MKFTYALACAGVFAIVAATPAMAQLPQNNATIEGTQTDPGNEGMPSAAQKLGNLSTTPTGTAPLPSSDGDSRGGPVPDSAVNNSPQSVLGTPGAPATSEAK